MISFTYRPIERWPGPLTKDRKTTPFRASFDQTVRLLSDEVEMLGGHEAVIQLALSEGDVRRDGMVRANSRPSHPGVIVAFKSRDKGPLQFATDAFEGYWSGQTGWHANLRAVALGLQALRAVDRYGITRTGEQYRGWQALPPGTPLGPASERLSVEDAARFLIEHGEWGGTPASVDDIVGAGREVIGGYFREAAKKLHPDVGGDPALFRRLQEARSVLEAFG